MIKSINIKSNSTSLNDNNKTKTNQNDNNIIINNKHGMVSSQNGNEHIIQSVASIRKINEDDKKFYFKNRKIEE